MIDLVVLGFVFVVSCKVTAVLTEPLGLLDAHLFNARKVVRAVEFLFLNKLS